MTVVLLALIAVGVWVMAAETVVLVVLRLRERREERRAVAAVLRERDQLQRLSEARARRAADEAP